MIFLKIDQSRVTPEAADALMKCCPFSAITYEDGKLDIGAGCRMCKLCVKKGPQGVVTIVETHDELVDKSLWNGVCVYAEAEEGVLHPVTFELIGKARELASVTKHEVFALLIGHNTEKNVQLLLEYGVDRVYVYDYPEFADFVMLPYANAFADFIERVKPSSILVGATNVGRSLAPRIAARFKTGLTADCTVLEMYENTDLVQIRPAFGGNIMAKILCPKTRPQLCTVRYKIFSAPEKTEPHGKVFKMELDPSLRKTATEVLEVIKKAKEKDISDAEIIVAAGRGVKKEEDFELVCRLAELLGAEVAGTRPIIELGWLDPKRQIGLSGRTVKPKLIITVGVSGSVQFAAGMKNSECIIAINSAPAASIFNIAHYGYIGDLYEILPRLIEKIGEEKKSV